MFETHCHIEEQKKDYTNFKRPLCQVLNFQQKGEKDEHCQSSSK